MTTYVNRTKAPIHFNGLMMIPGVPTREGDVTPEIEGHRDWGMYLKARFIEAETVAETEDQAAARRQTEAKAEEERKAAEAKAAKAAQSAQRS